VLHGAIIGDMIFHSIQPGNLVVRGSMRYRYLVLVVDKHAGGGRYLMHLVIRNAEIRSSYLLGPIGDR
jgi:hypothetical protein